MITLDEYFGPWVATPEVTEEMMDNAEHLLERVSQLMALALSADVPMPTNPNTNSQVSGQEYGGFRPRACPIGAPSSAHKQARAVDVFDPNNALDNWITNDILEQCGLYREHPDSTQHWCHLTDRAPGSGHRTFLP